MATTEMLVRPAPIRKGPPCTVGVLMSKLPEDERAGLQQMLDDCGWLGTDISREVAVLGYARIAGQTFNRHRRGACQCP